MADGNLTVKIDLLNLQSVKVLYESARHAVTLLNHCKQFVFAREAHHILKQALTGIENGFELAVNPSESVEIDTNNIDWHTRGMQWARSNAAELGARSYWSSHDIARAYAAGAKSAQEFSKTLRINRSS